MPAKFSASRDTSPPDVEAAMRTLRAELLALEPDERRIELRLPAQSTQILGDVWLSIVAGSAAARLPTRIIARGYDDIDPTGVFATSLAGLSVLQTAEQILPEKDLLAPLDREDAIQQLMAVDGGLIPARAGGQILLEVDPDYSIASRLRAKIKVANPASERRRMFAQLVLQLRKRVEIGALRRTVDPVSEGPAGAVGRFLFELHENGLEHGSRKGTGEQIRGTRMLRVRKHIANNAETLAGRHGGVSELQRYLERINTPALIEASISDFGPGIVDGFLATSVGASHRNRPHDEILHDLLFDKLSSKGGDPAAGRGIQRALRAAMQMQAFVSVRTGKFWLAASFADPRPDIRLTAVHSDAPLARVRGTHWQILWPQP